MFSNGKRQKKQKKKQLRFKIIIKIGFSPWKCKCHIPKNYVFKKADNWNSTSIYIYINILQLGLYLSVEIIAAMSIKMDVKTSKDLKQHILDRQVLFTRKRHLTMSWLQKKINQNIRLRRSLTLTWRRDDS